MSTLTTIHENDGLLLGLTSRKSTSRKRARTYFQIILQITMIDFLFGGLTLLNRIINIVLDNVSTFSSTGSFVQTTVHKIVDAGGWDWTNPISGEGTTERIRTCLDKIKEGIGTIVTDASDKNNKGVWNSIYIYYKSHVQVNLVSDTITYR